MAQPVAGRAFLFSVIYLVGILGFIGLATLAVNRFIRPGAMPGESSGTVTGIDPVMARSPEEPIYTELSRNFPEEYQRVRSIIYRTQPGEQRATAINVELARFFAANIANAPHASDPTLMGMVRARSRLFHRLHDENPSVCAGYAMNRQIRNQALSNESRAAVIEVDRMLIATMRLGRDYPSARPDRRAQASRDLQAALRDTQAPPSTIALLANPAALRAASEAEQCDTAVRLFDAMKDMPEESAATLEAASLAAIHMQGVEPEPPRGARPLS